MSEITVGTIGFPVPGTNDQHGFSKFCGPTASVAVFVHGLDRWHVGHAKAIEKALREVEVQKDE